MRQQIIICEHCGSTNVSRDPAVNYAIVQQVSQKTGKPIGGPKTYYMFKCLSCGEGVYLEKYEAPKDG